MNQEKEITLLERQKKNRHRVNVFLNGEYAFAVHEDIIVKYRLLKGKTLHTEDVDQLLLADELKRAEWYGIRYLGIRPRTEEEIKKHLHEKGFTDEMIEKVRQSFREKKYLDDRQYARDWVLERMRLKPRGKNMLRYELIQKGVDPGYIDEALERVGGEEEVEAAVQIALKKYSCIRFASFPEMRKKVGPFLQRKGFSFEVVVVVFERIKEELIEQAEDKK